MVEGELSDRRLSLAESIGWAVYVMSRGGCYASYPIASLTAWLIPAARLGQLKIFTDVDGQVLGYMTWARLSADTEDKWIRRDASPWPLSAWNEGTHLWILDFAVLPGGFRECIRQACGRLSEESAARYLRQKTGISRFPKRGSFVQIDRLPENRLRFRQICKKANVTSAEGDAPPGIGESN